MGRIAAVRAVLTRGGGGGRNTGGNSGFGGRGRRRRKPISAAAPAFGGGGWWFLKSGEEMAESAAARAQPREALATVRAVAAPDSGGAVFCAGGWQLYADWQPDFFPVTRSRPAPVRTMARAAGGDLFIMTGATSTFAPGTGHTQTFNEAIADDSFPQSSRRWLIPPGPMANGAAIVLGSAGQRQAVRSSSISRIPSAADSRSPMAVTVQAGDQLALGTGGRHASRAARWTMGNNVHALTVAAYNAIGRHAAARRKTVRGRRRTGGLHHSGRT